MFNIIGSADPKYLAATDLLVGDMSNINYEFLLFNRPIVLLANKWIKRNFPDIGPKIDQENLKVTIEKSLQIPNDYEVSRRFWLERTISIKENSASQRYIDIILEQSGIVNPEFIFVWGDAVRKTNIEPLVNEVISRGLQYLFIKNKREVKYNDKNSVIIVAAHYIDLWPDVPGYKVHIDHDLKGVATANIKYAVFEYKRNNYFPHINLHIVAGEAGDKRTKFVLGPLADRTVIGGYPKGDDLIRLNTLKNKKQVFKELGNKESNPLITYAPAGQIDFMKPGGSLNNNIIKEFEKLSSSGKYNVLVKIKYKKTAQFRVKQILKKTNIFQRKIIDNGSSWNFIYNQIINNAG